MNKYNIYNNIYNKTILKHTNLNYFCVENVCISTICCLNTNTDTISIYNTYTKSGNGGAKTNRTCPTWLGNHTEVILMNMFKKVEKMPTNNIGYDFLCGNGYKIDAKSSCLDKTRSNTWTFCIERNKTADFFLCLALDNREDLNPLHVWLIPGNTVNNLISTSISKSTLSKWSKYEKSLDKVLSCCNIIKNDYTV